MCEIKNKHLTTVQHNKDVSLPASQVQVMLKTQNTMIFLTCLKYQTIGKLLEGPHLTVHLSKLLACTFNRFIAY